MAGEWDAKQAAREMIALVLDICDCGFPTDPTCGHCAPGAQMLADVTAKMRAACAAGLARGAEIVERYELPTTTMTITVPMMLGYIATAIREAARQEGRDG